MIDYYAILGVPEDADTATVKRAYRLKAVIAHPDHGGSHEAMLAINEAGFILTNPERRRRYDEARHQPENPSLGTEASNDAENAKANAGKYPKDKDEFESWMDNLSRDFASATYSHQGFFPSVENSSSGGLFLFIGIVLGGVVGYWLFWPSGEYESGFSNNPLKAILFCSVGGGSAALWLHREIGKSLKTTSSQSKPTVATEPPQSTNTESASQSRVFMRCPGCAKTVRFRTPIEPATIRCSSCRHEFRYMPRP